MLEPSGALSALCIHDLGSGPAREPAIWPRLEADELHLWAADLDLDAIQLARLQTSLTEAEWREAARRRFARDRDRAVASRGLLRWFLGRYLELSPADIVVLRGPYGKPYLADASTCLRFNLTHSGGLALFAFVFGREVGIDLQKRTAIDLQDLLSARFLTAGEVRSLQRLPVQLREESALRCWTRKEALVKAMGLGMSAPLDDIEVTVAPSHPAVVRVHGGRAAARRWWMTDLELGPEYAACAVAQGSAPLTIRGWDLPSAVL